MVECVAEYPASICNTASAALYSDKKIMGEFANKGIVKGITWFLATLVIIINVYLVTTFVTAADSPTPQTPLFSFIIFVGLSYFGFIFFVIKKTSKNFWLF